MSAGSILAVSQMLFSTHHHGYNNSFYQVYQCKECDSFYIGKPSTKECNCKHCGNALKNYTMAEGNCYDALVHNTVKGIRNMFNDSDHKDVFTCINHLGELSKADLSCIPRRWKGRFNELIKAINANSRADGYAKVYREIEHAYNIYQLSKSKEAVAYGLDKLSDKTPYQLFTEFRKMDANYPIPKKEMFDKFDRFVPLQTTGTKSECAYYSPTYQHVRICTNNDSHNQRLLNSEWYKDGLFYHEFGHAYADMKKMDSDTKMKDVFSKHKGIVAKDSGRAVEAAIIKKLNDEKERIRKELKNSAVYKELEGKIANAKFLSDEYFELKGKIRKLEDSVLPAKLGDLEEQLGGLSDTLMAMIEGSRWISPRGHYGDYFSGESQQLHEFQAHCAENYWKGNKYFKELMPDLYEDMKKLWGGY